MGPTLLDRGAARGLVLQAQRHHAADPVVRRHPAGDVAGARAGLHRRRQARACAATSRSCSRSSRPGWMQFPRCADPARLRTTTPGIFAFNSRRAWPKCARRRLALPSRCMAHAAARRARADPAAAQLRRPPAKTAKGRSSRAAVRPRRRRADLGVLRRPQLPVRQADLGDRPTTTASAHHPDVLAGARRERQGGRVRRVPRRRSPGPSRAPATGTSPRDSVVHSVRRRQILR